MTYKIINSHYFGNQTATNTCSSNEVKTYRITETRNAFTFSHKLVSLRFNIIVDTWKSGTINCCQAKKSFFLGIASGKQY